MKNSLILQIIIITISVNCFSQSVGIADHEIVPHHSAALEIMSNTKGLLIPRMTEAQRLAISGPAEGLLVYQTNNTAGFYFFDGNEWNPVSSSAGDLDTDPTNEIQTLSISNDTIYLSGGGYIKIPQTSSGTDEQQLRLSGDTLFISNGNYVLLTPIKDNLGNHSATQNIRLNAYYLSSDGDNEGIRVGTNGNVETSHNLTVNGTTNLAGLNTTGTVNLGANAIQSSEIEANAVTGSKIADNSITTAKIQDAQITAAKLHPMGAGTDQFLRFDGTSWGPASISSGLNYAGTWDASTNTPTLSDATGTNGQYYIVSVAGTQDLGSGSITFDVGDWAIHDGTSFQKINNSNDVNSVFGRKGTVTAQIGDYTWGQIDKTVSSINDIANVEAGTATAGNLLVADGNNWVSLPVTGDITLTSTGNFQIKNGIIEYSDLKDATGAANTILRWNGTAWEEVLLSSVESDTSSTNELQNLSISGNTLSISNGNSIALPVAADTQKLSFSVPNLSITGGNSVDMTALDKQTLALSGSTISIQRGNSIDLSGINTDNQDLSLTGNTLSLTGDATTVDLTPYANTDNQDLSLTGNTLSLTNDATTVSLAAYLDNTDAQTLTFASPNLSISGGNTVSLSALNTDAQTLTFASPNLSISGGNSVSLSALNTDSQQLTLTANSLALTNDATPVDLSPYLDNTDSQALTFTSPNLSISGGNTISLSAINTDAQTLSFTSPNLTISGGNSVSLSTLNTDNQDLSLTGNILSLTNDATTVNLAPYLDNTDSQTLTFTSPNLSISGGNTVDLSSLTGSAQTLTFASPNLSISGGNTISLSAINTDNQDLTLSGNILSLTNDATTVSLAAYLDNTDSQALTFTSPNLSISGGNSVDISSINTDAQTLSFTSPNLTITGGNSVSLSTLNTDAQTLSFASPNLTISGGNSISLSALSDNLGNHTATQNILLNGHWLSNDGGDEGVFVSTAGLVGIGTNTPITPLNLVFNRDTIMRIESSATNPVSILQLSMNNVVSPTTSNNFIQFIDGNGTPIGQIVGNGSAVLYQTTSDIRLKENLDSTAYGLPALLKIKVYDYNYIGSTVPQTGFIAQELYKIYPLAVTIGGDDPKSRPWGIDYSKLTPLLTKSIQDLNAKVENLENDYRQLKDENEKLKNQVEKLNDYQERLELLEKQVNELMQNSSLQKN